MSSGPGILKRAWFKWKTLKLPWRKQFLIGFDLAGNSFWEFKDALNANRLRRIVKFPSPAHHADVKISPQWHQWLRHTRANAPSLQEQQQEISRQAMMKELAAKADERWKSVPSYLDSPQRQQPSPALSVDDPGGYAQQTEPPEKEGVRNAVEDPQRVVESAQGQSVSEGRFAGQTKEKRPREENPFNRPQQGAPSENWQPQSWTPGVAPRR